MHHHASNITKHGGGRAAQGHPNQSDSARRTTATPATATAPAAPSAEATETLMGSVRKTVADCGNLAMQRFLGSVTGLQRQGAATSSCPPWRVSTSVPQSRRDCSICHPTNSPNNLHISAEEYLAIDFWPDSVRSMWSRVERRPQEG